MQIISGPAHRKFKPVSSRRAVALALEQEMAAKTQEMLAKVVEAEVGNDGAGRRAKHGVRQKYLTRLCYSSPGWTNG
ncbi:MAG TPA: hypothetical protein VGQ95_11120 [Chthoniobacterales bacterium]|nr:hypothetical protein [Chthoniobacterales bacterium]